MVECITVELFGLSSFHLHCTLNRGFLFVLSWCQGPPVDTLHGNLINITKPLISYQPSQCSVFFVRVKGAPTWKYLYNLQNMILIYLLLNHIPSTPLWVTCLAFIFPKDPMSRVIHFVRFVVFSIYWACVWAVSWVKCLNPWENTLNLRAHFTTMHHCPHLSTCIPLAMIPTNCEKSHK